MTRLQIDFDHDAKPRRFERRRAARVDTNFGAAVEVAGSKYHTRVTNMGMSGAYISLEQPGLPEVFVPGAVISLEIHLDDEPEVLALTAEIVRTVQENSGVGAGVRFIDVDEGLSQRVEGAILRVLRGIDEEDMLSLVGE